MTTRGRPRAAKVVRTADESAFSRILDELVAGTPGCRAVAFVDQEGEAIDIAGTGDEFDIKVVGAHMNFLLDTARSLGVVRRLVVRGSTRSLAAITLPEGYSLVFILHRGAAFHASERALAHAASELAVEAGFGARTRPGPRWFPVEVAPLGAKDLRPTQLRPRASAAWHDVQILGTQMGLAKGERGYRIRTARGVEAMLVREPLGRWWCDEPVERSEARPRDTNVEREDPRGPR